MTINELELKDWHLLPVGWDSHNADPPTKLTCDNAVKIIEKLEGIDGVDNISYSLSGDSTVLISYDKSYDIGEDSINLKMKIEVEDDDIGYSYNITAFGDANTDDIISIISAL